MHMYFKVLITILGIVVTFVKCREIKDKHKRIFVIMAILLAISTFSNQSIYWFLYWDGPYYGQVVDADTGAPIQGASVAGIWKFEGFILFITSLTHFANAKETVTDADGKYTIPLTFAFTFWPFSTLDKMELVVFKTGHDSHPPVIQRKMKEPPEGRRTSPDGKYYIGNYVSCKAWRKCQVRLNKAVTTEERMKAVARCGSRLGAMGVNRSKVYSFLKLIEKENPNLKYIQEKK